MSNSTCYLSTTSTLNRMDWPQANTYPAEHSTSGSAEVLLAKAVLQKSTSILDDRMAWLTLASSTHIPHAMLFRRLPAIAGTMPLEVGVEVVSVLALEALEEKHIMG
jgi:hypothetical protein